MLSCRGFTLLELLVSVAIFTVMGALAYGGLTTLVTQREALAEHSDDLSTVQKAMYLLQQDLGMAVFRPVRDALGAPMPPLIGGRSETALALTRADGNDREGPGLVRVEYQFVEDALRRRIWPVLDRMPQHEPHEMKLVEGVDKLSIRFLVGRNWKGSWPIGAGSGAGLPHAVEISVALHGGSTFRRVFPVGKVTG